jgi:hypothetical protein
MNQLLSQTLKESLEEICKTLHFKRHVTVMFVKA